MKADHIDLMCQYIADNTCLTSSEINKIVKFFKIKKLKKNDVFIECNTAVRWVGFLSEGILEVITYSNKPEPEIFYFIKSNTFFSEFNGYNSTQQAQYTIRASTPSTVLYISTETLNNLCKTIPNLEKEMKQIENISYKHLANMVSVRTYHNEIARFKDFIIKFPDMVKPISGVKLSNFLHINYNYFRRIRKKPMQKCDF